MRCRCLQSKLKICQVLLGCVQGQGTGRVHSWIWTLLLPLQAPCTTITHHFMSYKLNFQSFCLQKVLQGLSKNYPDEKNLKFDIHLIFTIISDKSAYSDLCVSYISIDQKMSKDFFCLFLFLFQTNSLPDFLDINKSFSHKLGYFLNSF